MAKFALLRLRRSQTEAEPVTEVNIIPVIDISLVLLVILFVTAPLLSRLPRASTETGANCVAGPSGFGDKTALKRSRPRNSSGPYSSDIAGLALHAKSAAHRAATAAAARDADREGLRSLVTNAIQRRPR